MNWLFSRGTVLDEIVERVRLRVSADKFHHPVADLKSRIRDARPVTSFADALRSSFGLIAEIKRRSPSQGVMRHQDIREIARIYNEHPFVRAVSLLTNRDDFEMSIKDLGAVRPIIDKPILRKDFIFDEYQLYEARAYGADAVLLMANVVTDPLRMRGLFDLSRDLGMDVLFECRSRGEIAAIPEGAQIYGINSRKLKARKILWFSRYTYSKLVRHIMPDRSIETDIFDLAKHIPINAVKVAESGMGPREIGLVRDRYRYNSALVGTSILNASEGVSLALDGLYSASTPIRNEAKDSTHRRHSLVAQ